jgi:biotin transport system permease protein
VRNTTLGLYQPGDSVLHRLPAGAKLLGLLASSAAAVFLQRWLPALGAYLLFILGLYLLAGLGLRTAWQQVRPVLFLLLFTAAMHVLAWLWGGATWHNAVAVPGMMACLVLAAALVTLTTPTTDLIDVVVRLAGPLHRFGVEPERVGLALLLGIRCVPLVAGLVSEVRQAQIARSGQFSLSAFAVPLVVSAIRQADSLGEALVARGIDD